LAQEINDKVVVITGASSGLGEATARRLAREGAKLVLGARRLERLQALAEELSLGDEAVVQTDVTDYEQVRHLVDHAVQIHGRVDAIINNAGLMPLSPLEALRVVSPRTAQRVSEEFTELPRRLLLGNRASAKLRSEVPKEQR
jgi:NADP-dependent 3-hydroxy acid dehydrogenase YdfG